MWHQCRLVLHPDGGLFPTPTEVVEAVAEGPPTWRKLRARAQLLAQARNASTRDAKAWPEVNARKAKQLLYSPFFCGPTRMRHCHAYFVSCRVSKVSTKVY